MIGFVLQFIVPVKDSHYGYFLQASKKLAMPLAAYNGLNICVVYFVFVYIFMPYFTLCCH